MTSDALNPSEKKAYAELHIVNREQLSGFISGTTIDPTTGPCVPF
jgi:hypothetical protein